MDSFQKNNMLAQNSSNNAKKKQSANNSSDNEKRKQPTNNSLDNEKRKQSANNSLDNEKRKQPTDNSSDNKKKKQPTNYSSNNKKKKQSTNNSSILHCMNGNNLELIVAALLLTGKLRVDAVQLFRQATMIVSLTGKYVTLGDLNNTNVDSMLKFLNDNGNITVDEIIQALKKKMDN
ncbi:hypothetical protein [Brevibacillus halotolerans]|uniref:hypothetical protein n=1 Tax=Brevibacillus halotolerans TaxID=1507437 RepID=UPI0015EEA588|nr:hypothetical protein [Brevibacillus halotolerans]MBA4535368.1 hypothetical protein [Brevibacillus halotolerans]